MDALPEPRIALRLAPRLVFFPRLGLKNEATRPRVRIQQVYLCLKNRRPTQRLFRRDRRQIVACAALSDNFHAKSIVEEKPMVNDASAMGKAPRVAGVRVLDYPTPSIIRLPLHTSEIQKVFAGAVG